MATFFNQASLSYDGNVVNSNTTEAEVLSGVEITKRALTSSYGAGGSIVYAITLSNMGGAAYNSLTVTDDLGAYTLAGGGTVVPLTYVEGSILYYLDGILEQAPTVTAGDELQISGINLPAGSTVTLIYETEANEFAPLSAGSEITNTARVEGACAESETTASVTVPVDEEPILTIAKAVCPPVLTDCGEVTYTLIVQNLGNTPIVATDGVIVSDVFNPILSDITVTLNGEPLSEGAGYTYNAATGEFATTDGTITVPAATYTQDETTGAITTTPGVAVITVTGTV